MSTNILDLQITAPSWKHIRRLRPRLEQAAQTVVDHVLGDLRIPVSASVLLAGNARVRQLNRDFRGKDVPTNVLSFPQFSPRELKKIGAGGEPVFLGDIALAYAYVAAEAKRDNKKIEDHSVHLVIHGLLHLLGYDHISEREACAMEDLEINIMRTLGLSNPYVETDAAVNRKKRKT